MFLFGHCSEAWPMFWSYKLSRQVLEWYWADSKWPPLGHKLILFIYKRFISAIDSQVFIDCLKCWPMCSPYKLFLKSARIFIPMLWNLTHPTNSPHELINDMDQIQHGRHSLFYFRWWDEWDDTVLQTQNSKFEPWRPEAEHATSRSQRFPTILSFTRGFAFL